MADTCNRNNIPGIHKWFESRRSYRPRCNVAILEVKIPDRFSHAVCGIRLSVPYAGATSALSCSTSDLHYNLGEELILSSYFLRNTLLHADAIVSASRKTSIYPISRNSRLTCLSQYGDVILAVLF